MRDLYEFVPIFRLPPHVSIEACVCGQSSNGTTFVMSCNNYHLLIYHTINSNTAHNISCDKELHSSRDNVIVRQLKVDKTKGRITGMCLNESATNLIVVSENSSIVLIPIISVIQSNIEDSLDFDAKMIETCSLISPTAIVWWNSLDQTSDIAIVGNDFGEISFIDIKTGTEIGGTYVQNSVKSLGIIKDRFGISLIITCKNEMQWRMTLEQTRSSQTLCTTNQLTTQQYFICFTTSSDEKEEIGPNNCWNTKPILINMSDDQTVEDTNIIRTKIVYQNPHVLSISESLLENYEFGQIVLRVMPNHDFNYTFASFLTKYIIPKCSSDVIISAILTDRLFLICSANECFLVSREFADARKLAKLNSIIQKFKFECEQFVHVFHAPNDNNEQFLDSFVIFNSHCIYECRPKNSCQQLFASVLTSASLLTITSEATLAIKAQRFASMLGLNLSALYEEAADLCLEKSQFTTAVRFYQLAKTPQIKRIANFVSYGYLSQVIAYIEILFSTKCHELEDQDKMHFANIAANCLVQQLLDKKVKSEETDTLNSLKLFLRDNLYYDESVVLRLLVEQALYDLAEYCAHLRAQYSLLLNYLLKCNYLRAQAITQQQFDFISQSDYKDLIFNASNLNFSYLNCITSKQVTYALILRRDIIANYLRFVVKLLPNLNMPFLIKLAVIFDPRRSVTQLLLNRVLANYKESYLNVDNNEDHFIQKKDVLNFFIFVSLMIIRQTGTINIFDEKYISIDSFMNDITTSKKRLIIETVEISAGQFHSAYILNGCLYLWGKSQFGCLGVVADDSNVPRSVPNPTRLNLFKDVLSISVKAVSCGSQHTLVLTDFGVYAFGSSRFGQLGLGKGVVLARNPIIISDLVNEEIIKIECGHYHSMVITVDGVLYTWGWGLHGQLGNGSIEDSYTPTVVQYFKGIKIVQICGGYAHTIALDSDGTVYSFGNGTYGQLGLNSNVKHSLPQKVILLCVPISKISTKYFHCLALTRDSQKLYVWGLNPQMIRIQAHNSRKARLNQPQPIVPFVANQDHLRPKIVDTSNISGQIVKLCAGNTHSLLLSSDGEIYSFGRGIDGQLGHGKVKELKVPLQITSINDINIVDIAAGCDFSLAIDINGCIWGWGQNNDCQIGPKPDSSASSTLDDNKKISIRTNRRVITLVPGGRVIEHQPIRINIVEEVESYCDSLNYSLDINAMRASTLRPKIREIDIFSDKDCTVFDHQILASTLAYYQNELDLNCVLNRCQNFKCFQVAAFICELQKDFPKALTYQLQALIISDNIKKLDFESLCVKIFCKFADKVIENLQELSKIINLFIQFWYDNCLLTQNLEVLLEKCYKNHINDSMFGISFFSYLSVNESVKEKFSSTFLLEMVDFTIKIMTRKPEKLFIYQTAIEKITSNIDNISFPSEKLWQDILSHFQCMTLSKSQSDTGIEIVPYEDEIIFFACSHYYGSNEFKLTILPDFKRDITETNGIIAQCELNQLLRIYNDFSKEIWDNVCPKCIMTDVKSKRFLI